MSDQANRVLELVREAGVLRPRDLEPLGIPRTYLSRLYQAGRLERLLYRLSHSPHHDRFALKGAMLFILWSRNPHRPTRDVDFLGFGDSSETGLLAIFRDLCAMPDQGDGVTFVPESVRVEPIRDDTEYRGMRVTLTGQLALRRNTDTHMHM